MKTKLLLLATVLFTSPLLMRAADLCVNENGNNGCYATIASALAVAVNGDRILVTPKAGHAPYVENLNLNKSVYIICAVDTEKFDVQGTMTVTPAVGRSITVIGMHHVGNIGASGHSPAGVRCSVSFLSCAIEGNLNFDYNYFNYTLASSSVIGSTAFRFGRAIGNDITVTNTSLYLTGYYSGVYLSTDALATNDTILVVGNIMRLNASTYCNGVFAFTNSQFVHILNNLVLIGPSTLSWGGGVMMYDYKTSTLAKNVIMNNTIHSSGAMHLGIYFINMNPGSYTEVLNNLILGTSSAYGSIYNANGTIAASYNVSNIAMHPTSLDACSCNVINSMTTLDAFGRPQAGSDAINGGSPDFSYYDLDLSINDAGAYGGSFTLDNFFPLTGSTRVFMVLAPRRVNVSGTINIKADTFDR